MPPIRCNRSGPLPLPSFQGEFEMELLIPRSGVRPSPNSGNNFGEESGHHLVLNSPFSRSKDSFGNNQWKFLQILFLSPPSPRSSIRLPTNRSWPSVISNPIFSHHPCLPRTRLLERTSDLHSHHASSPVGWYMRTVSRPKGECPLEGTHQALRAR